MEKVEDYRDPEVLRRMYWDEGLTCKQMAERLYVDHGVVLKYMHSNGIPLDPERVHHCAGRKPVRHPVGFEKLTISEVAERAGIAISTARQRLMRGLGPDKIFEPTESGRRRMLMDTLEDYKDPEVLRRLYWDENLSIEEMADRLYVSVPTIRMHMHRNNIPFRPQRRYFRGKIDYRDKAVLEECIRHGMSNRDIAKKADTAESTILHWMRKFDLKNPNSRPIARYDVGGRMLTIAEMAAESGLTKSNIASRLQRGWKPETIMSVPSLGGTKYVRGPLAVKLRKEGKFEYGTYYQGLDCSDLGGHRGSNHGR